MPAECLPKPPFALAVTLLHSVLVCRTSFVARTHSRYLLTAKSPRPQARQFLRFPQTGSRRPLSSVCRTYLRFDSWFNPHADQRIPPSGGASFSSCSECP